MVGGEPIGLEQHLVVDVGVVEGDLAACSSSPGRWWNPAAARPCGWRRGGLRRDIFLLLRSDGVRGAVVTRRQLGGLLLLALGFEFFSGREAAVGGAIVQKNLRVLAIDLRAFGLAVRAVRAACMSEALVPLKADPAESVRRSSARSSRQSGRGRYLHMRSRNLPPRWLAKR